MKESAIHNNITVPSDHQAAAIAQPLECSLDLLIINHLIEDN